MLRSVREFFARRGVLEVQTPVLGRCTVADPAVDSLHTTPPVRFLQSSPEYHMKRLLAAGAPSMFQIGPAFRRDEAGRWHNPEFTMLEWYRRGFDADQLMDEVAVLVDALLGAAPYRRCAYADLLGQRFGLDVATADEHVCIAVARELGLRGDADGDAAMDLLIADALGALDSKRVFITDYPPRLAALARIAANGRAARFELVVDGLEIANGYHELTDADELASRMVADARRRTERGLPAVAADDAFLAAHQFGLPDCAGVAVGFDRLLALQMGADSIAETMAFDWARA